jgi:hypothetical protein
MNSPAIALLLEPLWLLIQLQAAVCTESIVRLRPPGLILLANSKPSNFNGFQSGHPGETIK